MTEKRFEIVGENFTNVDVTTYIVEYGDGDDDCFELYESKEDSQKVCDKLNNILDENEQLKQSVNNLKETILKITIAYQRKYDGTIVDLVDEIHDEDITDLIKELKE